MTRRVSVVFVKIFCCSENGIELCRMCNSVLTACDAGFPAFGDRLEGAPGKLEPSAFSKRPVELAKLPFAEPPVKAENLAFAEALCDDGFFAFVARSGKAELLPF